MKKKWRPFEEARKFVRSLDLKKENEWRVYCKSGKKPDDIPVNPNVSYKNKGWTTWGDFLRTGFIAASKRKYKSFEEARKLACSLKLNGKIEWIEFTKSGKKPKDIPSDPYGFYKNKGWNREN